MGVIIRKKSTGEVFDIPTDFSLEVNNTSPIFNDIGSKAVPTTFPITPHNAMMLGYAHRPDIEMKPTNEIEVIVSEGSFIREGMLYLNEALNTDTEYSVTLAFSEGIMYNKMKSMKLPNLPNLPTVDKLQDEMLKYMNELLHVDNLNSPLTVFPVLLKEQGKYKRELVPGIEIDVILYSYLNEVNERSDKKELIIKDKVKHLEGGTAIDIDVPIGYGITPFVRLWYVLELIFSHFGYVIKDNPFKSEFQLRRLVMLNNTIDTIVDNKINYAQLMPDVTIFELFTALFVRFGAKIFVDGNTKTVNIVLLRDILTSPADKQMGVASMPNFQYTPPKQLKLSAGKGLDKSSTETDTYEEFLAKYNNTIGGGSDLSYRSGMVFYQVTGIIYQTPVGEVDKPEDHARFVSSFHFDWNKQTEGIEVEEYVSVDEGLTMLKYDFDGKFLYYGIDYALRNSRLEVNQNLRDIDIKNKLAFAFDMGEGYTPWNKEYWGYKFGTILPYSSAPDIYGRPIYFEDKEGNIMKYALTFIGKDGCFVHFHKQHDAMLRHSNYIVKTKADLPKFEVSTIKYQQMYNIHSQPMLIDKLNYIVGDFNDKELTARTTRLYKPYDLEKEHGLPKPFPIKYQWLLTDESDMVAANKAKHWENLYKTTPPKPGLISYTFVSFVYEVTDRPNPPSDRNLWYLPPTDRQYENQTEIGLNKHNFKVKFTLKYTHYVFPVGGGLGETVKAEHVFSETLNYNSFFIPYIP